MRLGAPGIQRIRNVEPREINLCAYNRSLLDMRNYDLSTLVPSGTNVTPTDTISRYEMHFFNAIYNLTPDKLQKFACPESCETGDKAAGLYHNAYQTYTANIGPDSTKSMTISTHIDKRWDSISFMPELDLNFQAREMRHTHEMLIYGLVHGAIQYRSLAPAASDKRIFKYETSDERMTNLIVSNGTPCDEFYEVLDRKFFPEIERDIDIIISMIHSFSLIDSDELISILKSLCIFKFYEEIKALSDEAHNKISEDIAKGRFISMEDEDIGETTIRKMNAGFVKIYKKFSVVFAEYAKSMQEVSAVYALSEYVQIDQFIRINKSLIELIDDRNMNDFLFSNNDDRIMKIMKEHIMLLDDAIKRPHQSISEENKNTLKQQLQQLSAVYIQLSNLKA